jgi:hypothetical protein
VPTLRKPFDRALAAAPRRLQPPADPESPCP